MNLVSAENLVRLRVGLYAGLFFFSFFVTIAVPVTTNKLKHCFLYFVHKNQYDFTFGAASNCNYAVAMAIIFQLLYGLFRLVTLVLLMLGKFNSEFVLFSDLCELVYTAVDVVAWFLVFVSACILSAGINTSCDNYGSENYCKAVFTALGDDSAISRMHTAEAGAWISVILWLVLAVVGVFWLFRQGKLPFLSRSGGSGDGGASTGSGTNSTPQVETPPAADAPKY